MCQELKRQTLEFDNQQKSKKFANNNEENG
jgi:hypothetical protein